MHSRIRAIEYYLPRRMVSNEQLAAESEKWTSHAIKEKTGIARRHIASPDECASDLASAAAEKLFASGACKREEIDFILLCTQSPDYLLPTTACLLQKQLGLKTTCGALDFNLGCSGYVYGLGLAKGLIETRQAKNVLLLTAETYSKFIQPQDMNVRTLFGDAAAATLVSAETQSQFESIGPFVYGSDGDGAENLIVRGGGCRHPQSAKEPEQAERRLFMNGPEILSFTLRTVPAAVEALLDRAELTRDDISYFVFHQANRFMLEHLRKRINIPAEKFCLSLENFGNTVSSTIPIALKELSLRGNLNSNDRVLLVGFGVGYSWGASLIRWTVE